LTRHRRRDLLNAGAKASGPVGSARALEDVTAFGSVQRLVRAGSIFPTFWGEGGLMQRMSGSKAVAGRAVCSVALAKGADDTI
jgi:hypothetical protein